MIARRFVDQVQLLGGLPEVTQRVAVVVDRAFGTVAGRQRLLEQVFDWRGFLDCVGYALLLVRRHIDRVVRAVNDHGPDRLGEERGVPDSHRGAVGVAQVRDLLHAQGLAYFVHVPGDVGRVEQAADRTHGLDAEVGRRFAGRDFLGRVDRRVDGAAQVELLAKVAAGEFRL